jgi:hypothetical protein
LGDVVVVMGLGWNGGKAFLDEEEEESPREE